MKHLMGVTVKAVLGTTKYFTEVTAGENKMITDEPVDKGGGNKGFNPYENPCYFFGKLYGSNFKNVYRPQRLGGANHKC